MFLCFDIAVDLAGFMLFYKACIENNTSFIHGYSITWSIQCANIEFWQNYKCRYITDKF